MIAGVEIAGHSRAQVNIRQDSRALARYLMGDNFAAMRAEHIVDLLLHHFSLAHRAFCRFYLHSDFAS